MSWYEHCSDLHCDIREYEIREVNLPQDTCFPCVIWSQFKTLSIPVVSKCHYKNNCFFKVHLVL